MNERALVTCLMDNATGDSFYALEVSWPMTSLPSTTVWDGIPLTVTRSRPSTTGAGRCCGGSIGADG